MKLNWAKDERILATGVIPGTFLELTIPPAMRFRRIYCYEEVIFVTGTPDFFVDADFLIVGKGEPLIFPASLGSDDSGGHLFPQSKINVFANVPYIENGLLMTVSGPNTIASNVYLTPMELETEAEKVLLRINTVNRTTVAGFRALIAVCSSDQPFK